MNNINVLLYSNETLLDVGIKSLITSDRSLVLTTLHAGTVQELLDTANHLQPEVIIVEQRLLGQHCDLLNHLLKRLEKSRVITLDDEHNLLHLYSRQEIPIEQASDLVAIIRSNFSYTQ